MDRAPIISIMRVTTSITRGFLTLYLVRFKLKFLCPYDFYQGSFKKLMFPFKNKFLSFFDAIRNEKETVLNGLELYIAKGDGAIRLKSENG